MALTFVSLTLKQKKCVNLKIEVYLMTSFLHSRFKMAH
jgi:hypothetical protein